MLRRGVPELEEIPGSEHHNQAGAEENADKVEHPTTDMRRGREPHHPQSFLDPKLLLLHESAYHVRHRVQDRQRHQYGERIANLCNRDG